MMGRYLFKGFPSSGAGEAGSPTEASKPSSKGKAESADDATKEKKKEELDLF